jgi:hypothetical protein
VLDASLSFWLHIYQVSSCGETDPEVTSLVKQDPAKLQRLHDRLTSTTSTRLTTGTQKQVVNSSDIGESRLALAPSSPWSQVKTMDQRTKSQELRSMNDFSTGNAQVDGFLLFFRQLPFQETGFSTWCQLWSILSSLWIHFESSTSWIWALIYLFTGSVNPLQFKLCMAILVYLLPLWWRWDHCGLWSTGT